LRLSCNLFWFISDTFKQSLVGCLLSNRLSSCYFSDVFPLCSFSASVGTFTLSNLGMFGVDRFDAILPPGTVMFFFFFFEIKKPIY
jgi:hypothetical protein